MGKAAEGIGSLRLKEGRPRRTHTALNRGKHEYSPQDPETRRRGAGIRQRFLDDAEGDNADQEGMRSPISFQPCREGAAKARLELQVADNPGLEPGECRNTPVAEEISIQSEEEPDWTERRPHAPTKTVRANTRMAAGSSPPGGKLRPFRFASTQAPCGLAPLRGADFPLPDVEFQHYEFLPFLSPILNDTQDRSGNPRHIKRPLCHYIMRR